MTKTPIKNGRAVQSSPAPQQQTYQADELVPEVEIEMARLRARNATLEAEFIAMRNELIKMKTELQRRIDAEGKGNNKQNGKAEGNNKVRKGGKNGGRGSVQ